MAQSRRSVPGAEAEAAADRPPRTIPSAEELFTEGYERWFNRLYAYVSRRVAGRQVRERIVREVLSENLDLLVGRREEALEVMRLKSTADRLIAGVASEADQLLDRRRNEVSSGRRAPLTELQGTGEPT